MPNTTWLPGHPAKAWCKCRSTRATVRPRGRGRPRHTNILCHLCYWFFLFCESADSGLQYVHCFFHLVVADDDGHQQTDDVAIGAGGDGDEAVLVAALLDFLGFFGRGL